MLNAWENYLLTLPLNLKSIRTIEQLNIQIKHLNIIKNENLHLPNCSWVDPTRETSIYWHTLKHRNHFFTAYLSVIWPNTDKNLLTRTETFLLKILTFSYICPPVRDLTQTREPSINWHHPRARFKIKQSNITTLNIIKYNAITFEHSLYNMMTFEHPNPIMEHEDYWVQHDDSDNQSNCQSIVINLVLDYKTIFVLLLLRSCVAVAAAVLHIDSDQSSVGL